MIPVEQRTLGGDTAMAGERGDCLRACVASIFERRWDEVPHFVAHEDWWERWNRWTEEQGFVLRTAWHSTPDDDKTRLNGHPGDIYWIANVLSPRLVRDDGEPGWHSVVMFAGDVAWDPHPEREMGHLGFTGIGYMFAAPDPAKLVLREPILLVPEPVEDPLPEDLERLLRDPSIVLPGDERVAEITAKYLVENPLIDRVPREAYLMLWYLHKRTLEEAA